jgi:ACS family D-galactonate transporter-like MFS transporter
MEDDMQHISTGADDAKAAAPTTARTHVRFFIVFLLFIGVVINYLDRTNMAVAAPVLQKDLNISPAMLGFIFSAFGWLYMLMQLPAGVVLDKFGTRKTFGWSLALWSGCTVLFGFAGNVFHLILLRMGLGITEAPCFPAAQRAVAAWFPRRERGMAVGLYVSGEFLGLAMFTPLLAWIVAKHGWHMIFFLSGGAGLLFALGWFKLFSEPTENRWINDAELQYLRDGGAVVGLADREPERFKWATVGRLLADRNLWGIYLGKFSLSSTLFFFFTWFPNYLVHEKHMDLIRAGLWSMLPFTAAMFGIILGGIWSDWMSRRGISHSVARKIPVVMGMLLCSTLVAANYTLVPVVVVAIMSLSFFGQGMAGGIDSIVADMAPENHLGTTIGLCQMFANFGGAVTPLVIGFIIQGTGSYSGGLLYVSGAAVLGMIAVTMIIKRVERVVVT